MVIVNFLVHSHHMCIRNAGRDLNSTLEWLTHREVVTQQLHDERAVFVRVFVQRIQLSDRIVKRLRRQIQAVVSSTLNGKQYLSQSTRQLHFYTFARGLIAWAHFWVNISANEKSASWPTTGLPENWDVSEFMPKYGVHAKNVKLLVIFI